MPPRQRTTDPKDNPAAPPNLDDLSPEERAAAEAELARLQSEDGSGGAPDENAPVAADADESDDAFVTSGDAEDEADGDSEYDDDGWDGETYVVVADAAVLKTGPKTSQTVRAHKGQLIRFARGNKWVDIDVLLRNKTIARNDGQPKARSTAKVMAAASGASDDPVKVPKDWQVKDETVTPANDPTRTG